jgi:hypothetical protein
MASLLQAALVPALVLVFCTWAVSLGGLAALQNSCYHGDIPRGILSLAPGMTDRQIAGCRQIYRFFWFVVIFEFFTIVATAIAIATPATLRSARMSLLGLYAVLTVLYLNMTNSFYSGLSIGYYRTGDRFARDRAMVAGCLMTAIVNILLIILLGRKIERTPTTTTGLHHTNKETTAV